MFRGICNLKSSAGLILKRSHKINLINKWFIGENEIVTIISNAISCICMNTLKQAEKRHL